MTAVKERGECAVHFDSGNHRYNVWSGGPNRIYDGGTGDDVLVRTVDLTAYGSGVGYGLGASPGISGSANLLDSSVVFNSRGFVNNAGGYVYFQNNRNGCYATGVSAAGSVLLRKWTGGAPPWE
jgi:hypothetical protein